MRRLIYKLAGGRIQRIMARLTRGMTLGSRIVVIDAENSVFLVKHTYVSGWILPGGGVERGETFVQAAMRELREEGGIDAHDLVLHGVYSQEALFRGDHVACFIVRNFKRRDWNPDAEIAAAQFFALDALPEDLTPGTQRRLDEIFRGAAISELW
jgi:ADP-ribose pyrophosphatase YjhB (NUDIX family)